MRPFLLRRSVAVLLLVVGAMSCDGSPTSCREDPWADDPANKGQAPNTFPSAPAANSLSSDGPAGTDNTVAAANLRVVSHSKLQAFLPALAGWTLEFEPRGDTDETENVSRVQVNYSQNGGIGGLGVEIMDTTGNPNMLGPLIGFIRANRGRPIVDSNATGVTPQEVKGFPAKQEWNADDGANNGTLGILLSGRFTVGITGNSLANSQVMKWAANSMDLKKLSELK